MPTTPARPTAEYQPFTSPHEEAAVIIRRNIQQRLGIEGELRNAGEDKAANNFLLVLLALDEAAKWLEQIHDTQGAPNDHTHH